MGDYADFVNEGLMDDYFYDIDRDNHDFDEDPRYEHGTSEIEYNVNFWKLDKSLLKIGDEWLYRKGISCKVNEVVKIVKVTDKAVLFEFVDEWENKYHWQMKGKQFWHPLSILYKHKNELKVIYVPHWATCTLINISEEERKHI